MSARGLLENPALFAGYDVTPPEVVSDWTTLALSYGVPTHIFHQHLMMMLYKVHNKEGELVIFAGNTSRKAHFQRPTIHSCNFGLPAVGRL